MSQFFVVGETRERVDELLVKRQVTLEMRTSKPLEAEYLLIADTGRGVPSWAAKIRKCIVSPGPFPKDVSFVVGEMASLLGAWTEVSVAVRDHRIDDGALIELNSIQLVALGEPLNAPGPAPGVLTAQQALPRLAWTYGVPEEKVKISIEF